MEDIATRAGAISAMKDLTYWSVSDGRWRKLISKSVALKSNNSNDTRTDFTGPEVLSGQTLYFAQNDTRSWGMNVYSFIAVSSSSTRLELRSENISPLKLGPITFFDPHSINSLVIVSKIDEAMWSYYSLVAIKESLFAASEKSLINRQAAAYRFLVGLPADLEPPVGP